MAKITFIQHNGSEQTVDGTPGMTVMETAIKHMVPGIDADCGGACACATCHVYVGDDWLEKLHPPRDDEEDLLFSTLDKRPNSRLSCQILLSEALDGLTVTIAPSASKG